MTPPAPPPPDFGARWTIDKIPGGGHPGRMIGRLHHTVLDCPDPAVLAAFYSTVLGQPITYRDDEVPQQFHLDIMVEDPAASGPRVLALGATRLDGENVYDDPAGHPFCLIHRPRWAPPIPADA